jgi:hypothetical protein
LDYASPDQQYRVSIVAEAIEDLGKIEDACA